MNNVESYNFGSEIDFSNDLSSDSLELNLFPNAEYCDLNIDVFGEEGLEAISLQLIDIDENSFEPILSSSPTSPTTDDLNFKNEDTLVIDGHFSDQCTSPNSELSVASGLEDNSPLLPFDEPRVKLDVVESELKKDIGVKNCLTKIEIKEEVKGTDCHFVPNSPEHLRTASVQHRNSKSPCMYYNGNIADLVKTRKRTCNNNKAKNTTNVKPKTKNRNINKKELTLKNTAVKSETEVPLLSSQKTLPNNSDSHFHSFNVLKLKTEPEEYTIQFDTLKHIDGQDSPSLYLTTSNFLKAEQKYEALPVQKSKTKSKKRKKHPENYSAALMTEKNLDYTDFRIHDSSLDTRNCQKLDQNFPIFKKDSVSQPYFTSLESPTMPSDLSLIYTNINQLKDDDLFAPSTDICSSPTENSTSKSPRQGESTSLLKLRISRCANEFKSYVIPAIPASHSLDTKKKSPKHFDEIGKEMSGNQNKHILDQRESKEESMSKAEKKKKKKNNERRSSHQKAKPNNQIHYVSKEITKSQTMNISPLKTETIATNTAESIPVISVKRESKDVTEIKVTEKRNGVLNQKFSSVLQDDILICQPFDIKKVEIFSDGKSEKKVRNSLPKAGKKIKKRENAYDGFKLTSLFNNQSDCDSNTVKNKPQCDAGVCGVGSAEPAKNVPVKKIKKEPIDIHEFSEFEMHQSVKLPIDDLFVPPSIENNVVLLKSGSKKTALILPMAKIKKEPIDTHEYSEFEMHQSVEIPLNDLNHTHVFNDKVADILQYKPSKKCMPTFGRGNIHMEHNTSNKEFYFNKVEIKSKENSCKRVVGSDSVLASSNIELNSRSKQPKVILRPSESNSPNLLYMSKENLDTSLSTCDFDLQNETYDIHAFGSMSFLKSTDSRGSLASSQGTIVNNVNFFQESETTVESNTEDIAKELVKNNLSTSPPFSDCDENATNDSKSSSVTNMERDFFEAKISDQGFCSSGTENDTEIQRGSPTPSIPDSKDEMVVNVPEHCLQVLDAKCTDSKAVGQKQCLVTSDETTQSANSAFLITTMQNSFHFQIGKKFPNEVPNQTINNNNGKGNSSGDNTSEPSSLEPKEPPRSKTGVRQYRSRKQSRSSSSSSSSDSFYDYKASKRVKKYHISRRKELLESTRKKSYSKRHKSSSKSSYSESRSCSRYSYSSTYDERSKSSVESFRKTEKRKRYSSRSRSRRRRHRSSSRSQSRSPGPRSRRNSSYHRSVSSSRKGVVLEEQEKQTDERRVVYVGQIPDGYSTSELRERFGQFGRIEDINIHRKNAKRNNNFGFVTFKYTEDACDAIAHGNDPPLKPKFDISFGGRRLFCRQRYSDLDKEKEMMENNDYYYHPPKANDFDSLLNAELQRTGLQDKKY